MKLALHIRTPDEEKTQEYENESIKIGRDAEVCLLDREVSRFHAEFYEGADGRLRLKDLGSTNGTLLDGNKILDSVLQIGSEIQIGLSYITVTGYQPSNQVPVPTEGEADSGIVLNQWPANLRAIPKDKLHDFVDMVSEEDRNKSSRLKDLLAKRKKKTG